MAYTVTSITPVLGGVMLRVMYRHNGGPERRAFFYPADLRRRTEALGFEDFFPLWLKSAARVDGVNLKTATLAELRSYVVGKTLHSDPTRSEADAADGV